MKTILFLSLTIFCAQPSFAIERMDLVMCLKTLNNTEMAMRDLRSQLNQCQLGAGNGNQNQMELERLRRDNQRLAQDNANLQKENYDLRRQLEAQRPPTEVAGFFSYAACTTTGGEADLRYIESAEARFALEAESNATAKTQNRFSCNHGVVVERSEALSFGGSNYCTAGCITSSGIVDARYSAGAQGRNLSEAEFLALQKAQSQYTCNFGVKVQNCQ